jgi:hypothetical protein
MIEISVFINSLYQYQYPLNAPFFKKALPPLTIEKAGRKSRNIERRASTQQSERVIK